MSWRVHTWRVCAEGQAGGVLIHCFLGNGLLFSPPDPKENCCINILYRVNWTSFLV